MPPAAGRLCLAVSLALPQLASAITLGDADVRSFLGQPLDVRIAIQADRNEWLDLNCVQAKLGDRVPVALSSANFRIQETLDTRTLIVRTRDPVVAPYLTLELNVRCEGSARGAEKTYALAVPPISPPAVVIHQAGESRQSESPGAPTGTTSSTSTVRSDPRTGSGSLWTTSGKDSLASIARGIYPRSAKMRAAFIERMRTLNPEAALPGDAELLTPGMKLRLPDLVKLANQSPRLDASLREARESATARAAGATSATDSIAAPKPAKTTTRTSAQPATQQDPERKSSASPDATRSAKPQTSPPLTTSRPAPAPSGGFTLRLSGVEMDLSRSKGVSESTRAALRDKQMLLDADDQVAALLALRNTVKQLESRLNDMQLKLSTGTLPAVAPKAGAETAPLQKSAPAPAAPPATQPVAQPVVAVVTPAPAAKAQPAPTDAAPAPAAAPSTTSTAPPATSITQAPPQPAASTPTPAPPAAKAAAPKTEPEPDTPLWQSPIFLGVGAALLLVLGWAGWRLARRGRGLPRTLSETVDETDASAAQGRATSDLGGPSSDDLPKSEWDDDDAYASGTSAYRSSPPSGGLRQALREAEHHETVRLNAPPDLIDSGATSLELDTRPATSVDFMLGDDGGEDKSRRQRYMEERFPELAHHSISVDEPDSIIDAARHHYEEGQLQKAIELLTYAFEERPGQLRFWLALFEIHRLEQRVGDFADLAARFKNVHGGTDAWPKVQHIGRDLDPGQPLYSAALGRLGVPMDADFDPMSENWLNVPMDFTSDVLMIELRHSLMAEHVVLDDELRRPLIEVPA